MSVIYDGVAFTYTWDVHFTRNAHSAHLQLLRTLILITGLAFSGWAQATCACALAYEALAVFEKKN